MIIVDGHEDLAYNVLSDGRDYLQSALVTRAAEEGSSVAELNGQCMLGLPEWLDGEVALIFATLFTLPRHAAVLGEMAYPSAEGAYQQALAQLRIYEHWTERCPRIVIVRDLGSLERVLATWTGPASENQVGLLLLMENAEPIRRPDDLAEWRRAGVRIIGPAWTKNRFTGSTDSPGPLTDEGRALLQEMDALDMVLDLTHMADEACREALELFRGPIVATHANPRRVVDRTRLIPDEVIQGIAAHDGAVGIMPANWALVPGWKKGDSKEGVGLETVVDAIDAVCQITGSDRHVGIGTDFDGGFGAEMAPAELDTISDLQKVASVLERRGYAPASIEAILHGNWLRLARRSLDTS